MTDYKWTKEVSGQRLYQEGACKEELDKFVRQFGFYQQLTQDDLNWISEHKPAWLSWLHANGLIEEDYQGTFFMVRSEQEENCWHLKYESGPEDKPAWYLLTIRANQANGLTIKRCESLKYSKLPMDETNTRVKLEVF